MKDLIKAAEASLDVVEKYNLKGENVQNKATELRATLAKAKDFQQKVKRLENLINAITAQTTKQP